WSGPRSLGPPLPPPRCAHWSGSRGTGGVTWKNRWGRARNERGEGEQKAGDARRTRRRRTLRTVRRPLRPRDPDGSAGRARPRVRGRATGSGVLGGARRTPEGLRGQADPSVGGTAPRRPARHGRGG